MSISESDAHNNSNICHSAFSYGPYNKRCYNFNSGVCIKDCNAGQSYSTDTNGNKIKCVSCPETYAHDRK